MIVVKDNGFDDMDYEECEEVEEFGIEEDLV